MNETIGDRDMRWNVGGALKPYKKAPRRVLAILVVLSCSLSILSGGSNGNRGPDEIVGLAEDVYSRDLVKEPLIPEIMSFGVDNSRICRNQCAVLSWEMADTAGAELSIDPEIDGGSIERQDSKEVCPEKTTTYVLKALRRIDKSNICVGHIGEVTIIVDQCLKPQSYDEEDSTPLRVLSEEGDILRSPLKISNVEDGGTVAKVITLTGDYPPGLEEDIWLFVVSPNGYYYPQSVDPCNESWRTPKDDGRWEMWVGLGSAEEVGEFFDIVLTVADSNASQMISSYLKDWCESNYYPGWKSLPPGVIVVERLTVIRNADPWGPALEISNADLSGEATITNIEDGDRIPSRIEVLGNCSSELEGDIWVLVYAPNGRWYPQSSDPCRGRHVTKADQIWEVPAIFGGENSNFGEAFDIVVILANDSASRFFNSTQIAWCNAGDYPGLLTIQLPAGIDEKDRVRVYRMDDRWPPAPDISNADLSGEVSFTNIADNGTVPQSMEILGNCSSELEGDIWTLVYVPDSSRWYPQSTNPCGGVHVQRAGQRWRVMGVFGGAGDAGKAFDVFAVLADEAASSFFDERQAEWCEAGDFPGLLTIELPEGIDVKDRARIIRR